METYYRPPPCVGDNFLFSLNILEYDNSIKKSSSENVHWDAVVLASLHL